MGWSREVEGVRERGLDGLGVVERYVGHAVGQQNDVCGVTGKGVREERGRIVSTSNVKVSRRVVKGQVG